MSLCLFWFWFGFGVCCEFGGGEVDLMECMTFVKLN